MTNVDAVALLNANQEDSIILNRTAIENGKFMAAYYKKYMVSVQKNQSTSQDDVLTKPDPTKIVNLRHGSYDKLNEKGYVPEEIKVENGDVIFGKITPVVDIGASGKPYRDSSEVYRMGVLGVIDRLHIDIQNQDGFLTREALIRSERVPKIGDKYASLWGQKGTIGLILSREDMPFTKEGLIPDLIINPNCIPSRMTMGQLVHCLFGKASVLEGTDADGTPFSETDPEQVQELLKKHGYDVMGDEYLYNGMTGEKMKVKIFIGPTFYQRLKHLTDDKIHCILSTGHEVLTQNGWKFSKDLTMDDKIACLNNEKLVYEKPIKILRYPNFEGKMYHIKTQQIDLTVTMEHRMWVDRRRGAKSTWGQYDFELAKDIVGKHRKYKKDAEWEAHDYQFVLPKVKSNKGIVFSEIKFNMDAWLKFFGLWIAEGCVTNTENSRENHRYTISLCVHKDRIKEMIDDVMKKLDYKYSVNNDVLVVHNFQLWHYLKAFSLRAQNKYLPDWVWKLSQRQCRILLEHMIMGDGCYSKNGTSTMYYTTSLKLVDDVMKLALHCGWSANNSLHIKAGTTNIIRHKPVTNNYNVWRLAIIKTKNYPAVNHGHCHEQTEQNGQVEEIIDVEEEVFCLQVPSEVFYIRCNGKACWTGNSRPRGPKTSLTRQAPEGRSRDGGLRLGEMERDSLIAHGLALFIKEKLMDNSDAYTTYVCGKCGLFAQRFMKKDDKTYASNTDIFYCKSCRNFNDIRKVKIPYAFKLFLQEITSMCIAPRLRFTD